MLCTNPTKTKKIVRPSHACGSCSDFGSLLVAWKNLLKEKNDENDITID
jgi:hypothetical protein